jgi:DNA-binding HxlR family transcriptional regulator
VVARRAQAACPSHRGRRSCTAASVEWIILDLLLEHSQTTWGIGELVDEIGSPSMVAEALEALQAAGLVERSGAFVRIAPV